MLKQTFNSEYRAKEEYRKNVTLVTKDKEINIPMLKEYVQIVNKYVDYLDSLKKK